MKCDWKREDQVREYITWGLIAALLLAVVVILLAVVGPFIFGGLVAFGLALSWLTGAISLCKRPRIEWEEDEGEIDD